MRRVVGGVAAAVLLAAALPRVALSQGGIPSLRPGDRVRVTAPGSSLAQAVGVVRDTANAALRIQLDRTYAVHTLPWSSITELDLSVERSSRFGTGLAVGLLGGASVGLIYGATSGQDLYTREQATGILAVTFGLIGGLLGGAIGSQQRTDEWARLPLGTPSVSAAPSRRGAGLQLRVSLP